MAWRIVKQPNDMFARFSDIVDDFTNHNMTEDEAFELCRGAAGSDVAMQKIEAAKRSPDRFEDSLKTVAVVHGEKTADERRAELSNRPATCPQICEKCGGAGVVDSGGVTPWGAGIDIPCECMQKGQSDTP